MVRDGDVNRGGMRKTRPYIKETADRAASHERVIAVALDLDPIEDRAKLHQLRIQVEARRALRLA